MNCYMKKAKEEAQKSIKKQEGGPFGVVIVNEQEEIIATGNNQVLKQKDPTAHAEIVAIRRACERLNTYDLSNCILYSSCQPCPMCLSAIIWSNIKTVYYGCTRQEAGEIGFRDDKIYDYLEGKQKDLICLQQMDQKECKEVFEEYQKKSGIIY